MSDPQREWAELGQLLSQAKLEILGTEIVATFRQTTEQVARGEEITESDVREPDDSLEEVAIFVDDFATIVPGSRQLDFGEHMAQEEIQRIAERIQGEPMPDRGEIAVSLTGNVANAVGYEVEHAELDVGETQLIWLTFDLSKRSVSGDFHIDQAEKFLVQSPAELIRTKQAQLEWETDTELETGIAEECE